MYTDYLFDTLEELIKLSWSSFGVKVSVSLSKSHAVFYSIGEYLYHGEDRIIRVENAYTLLWLQV